MKMFSGEPPHVLLVMFTLMCTSRATCDSYGVSQFSSICNITQLSVITRALHLALYTRVKPRVSTLLNSVQPSVLDLYPSFITAFNVFFHFPSPLGNAQNLCHTSGQMPTRKGADILNRNTVVFGCQQKTSALCFSLSVLLLFSFLI